MLLLRLCVVLVRTTNRVNDSIVGLRNSEIRPHEKRLKLPKMTILVLLGVKNEQREAITRHKNVVGAFYCFFRCLWCVLR